jgi:endoglucanase
VIKAIRKFDKKRQIIVGGTNFNSIEKLFQIPVYTDKNLIYTFHFYDPHVFTHQGATWNKPSLDPLSDLPFPAPSNFTPKIHETFKGTWVEDCLKNYENDSKLTKLSETLEKAVLFSQERKVPIFCGEFGVFMKQSPKEDRVSWYNFVCAEFAKKNIPWICWDYFGGFGIFKTQSRGVFPDDLDEGIVQAMGFKVSG